MSDETTDQSRVIRNVEDLDAVIAELESLFNQIDEINQTEAKVRVPFAELRATRQQQISELQETIAPYLMRRRRSWLRRWGRTAQRPNGTIKFRVIPTSVMTPKDEKPIIAELEKTAAGRKLLRYTVELDRDAIKNASPRMLRKLRPLGLHVGQQETLSLRLNGRKPFILRQYRFPRRR